VDRPDVDVRGVADKSLARPTSRYRRTESIVSLERGVCSCAELQVFSCHLLTEIANSGTDFPPPSEVVYRDELNPLKTKRRRFI
jgi:hypothetical protein